MAYSVNPRPSKTGSSQEPVLKLADVGIDKKLSARSQCQPLANLSQIAGLELRKPFSFPLRPQPNLDGYFFRMSCSGLSPPALVSGSRGSDREMIPTKNQVATTVRTVAKMIPATMMATSRFVKSAMGVVICPSLQPDLDQRARCRKSDY
jgi:hypothetical protein